MDDVDARVRELTDKLEVEKVKFEKMKAKLKTLGASFSSDEES